MAKQTGIKAPPAPYKGPSGHYFGEALFWDKSHLRAVELRPFDPVFSLYNRKEPGLINCQETFVAMGDPTGYEWAMKYLKDWNHWKYLMDRKWFREAYDSWVEELSMKLKAEALKRIQEISNSEDVAKALVAAKYLHGSNFKDPPKTGRGRPTSEQVASELKKEVRKLTAEDEDYERLGLTVIKGGKS